MDLDSAQRPTEVPLRRIIPNVITTAALCCGLAALHFSVLKLWDRAILAILFSAIFDALDGRAARLLRVTSRFGEVLDSLSDFLSFGVAPAMVVYQWMLDGPAKADGGKHEWENIIRLAAVVTFALCSAMRLARFTSGTAQMSSAVKANPRLGNYFTGMPTPAAAGAMLVPVMIDVSKHLEWRPDNWMAEAFSFLIAFLMVSRLPMFSLKKLKVARVWVAPILILVGLTVVCIVMDIWLTLAGLACVYLLTLPWSIWARRRVVAAAPSETGSVGLPSSGV